METLTLQENQARSRDPLNSIGEEFIQGVHQPTQKILLIACAPAGIGTFSYLASIFPVWQSYVLLVGVLLLVACWMFGYRFLQQGKNGESVACFVIPVSIQASLVMMLFDGYELASLWPMLTATVYGGYYSKRLMSICGGLMIGAPIWGGVVKHFDIYPLMSVSSMHKLVPVLLMSASAGAVLGFLLKRSLVLQAETFHSLGSANMEQEKVLTTVRKIQPEIEDAAREIEQISTQVATQAAEQATSTAEISTTVDFMRENAERTATHAAKTQQVSEQTRAFALKSNQRLQKIERLFDQVSRMISKAAEEVTGLSEQMEHIEEILDFNRKIGENIKVLSINAAIEADRAGQLGRGFGAVAAEFRDMIRDTEKNLAHSSSLLRTIRDRAKESSLVIIDGAGGLSQHFEALRSVGSSLKQNTNRFYETVKQVGAITKSAQQQQESVLEVSKTMGEIDRASLDLKSSAIVLLDVVEQIVLSKQRLEKVLEIE